MGTEFLFFKIKGVPEMGYTTVSIHLTLLNWTLKND